MITLQKCIVRIITFSEPASHSEPLLKSLNLLKCSDMINDIRILSSRAESICPVVSHFSGSAPAMK